jgi:glycosyltransferase involved in cell wall biosynthesis
VSVTGMGELVPPRDPRALAEAILRVLANRSTYVRPAEQIEATFGLDRALDFYEHALRREVSSGEREPSHADAPYREADGHVR